MNRINKTIHMAAVVVATAALTACNDIKEQDRFIELPAVEANRVVLMEEYTGQLCVNCPEAHEVVNTLLQQYPDNLISVSMHGGSLAYTEDKLPLFGLSNSDSEAYYTEANVPAPPAAVINRNSGVMFSAQWSAAIRSEIEKPTNVELEIAHATLSDDGRTINIETQVMPWDNMDVNLQLWVVESGIRSLQTTKDGMKADYEHNHVFRAAVNGHKGEPMHLTTRQGEMLTHQIQVRDDLKARWNADNLEIVAFVYDKTGVLQAAKAHVARAE